MVVHIDDVLRLQLCTEVVDFVLDVERAVDIVRLLATRHQLVHLRQRIVGEQHHLVQVVILLVGEVVLLALIFARDGASNVVAGVANRLQLGNLTQHGTNLCLRVVAEVGIAHLVEVFGNLNLHVVGDAFILLNA